MLDELAQLLDELPARAARRRRDRGTDPTDGSPAATSHEATVEFELELIRRAWSYATLALHAAEEMIGTAGSVLAHPDRFLSLFPLSRSALEHAVIAAWLLEPGIPDKVRAGRALRYQTSGLKQAEQMTSAGMKDQARQQRHDLNKRAREAGVQPEARLRTMEMAGVVLEDEELASEGYRILSGHTHGEAFALARYIVRDETQPRPSTDGMTTGVMAAPWRDLAVVVAFSVHAWTVAMLREDAYLGWQVDEHWGGFLDRIRRVSLEAMYAPG